MRFFQEINKKISIYVFIRIIGIATVQQVARVIQSPEVYSSISAGHQDNGSSAQQWNAARWYVAETHPRKELTAIEHLARQGFSTFFPRFRKRQIRRQRDETVMTPAFPGYVFVAFNIAGNGWASINSTRGIKRLVGTTPNKPQAVPDVAISLLKKRCRGEVIVNISENLKPGDVIQIYTGPLARKIATIESLKDEGRISVLFDILGGPKKLEINASDVGPAIYSDCA